MSFGWQGWFTIGVIAAAFICMLRDWAPADTVFLFSLVILMTAQVITVEQGLEGFSSQAVLSVAMLYTVAAGISGTGALDYIMNKVLGHPTKLVDAQVRLMFPIAMISAFLNNTPVVAVMIPIVQQWARKIHIPPTYVFIPLSFASILGGTCTLIGTSTNLVLQGKAEQTPEFKRNNITVGIFDVSTVGVPTLFAGFTYIFLFSKLLLPGVKDLEKRQNAASKSDTSSEKSTSEDGSVRSTASNPTKTVSPNVAQQSGTTVVTAKTNGKDTTKTLMTTHGSNTQSFGSILGSDVAHLGDLYTAGCIVSRNSRVCGKSVQAAGLRSLDHLFLTSVQRDNQLLGPQSVGPEFVLNAGDILFFAGVLSKFAKFCRHFNFTPIVLEDATGNCSGYEEDLYDSGYTDSEYADSDWGGDQTVFRTKRNRHHGTSSSDRGYSSPTPDWFDEPEVPLASASMANQRLASSLDTTTSPITRQAASDGQAVSTLRKPTMGYRNRIARRRRRTTTTNTAQKKYSSDREGEDNALGGDIASTSPRHRTRYTASVRSPRMQPSNALLNHHIVKVKIPQGSCLEGTTPKQVNFRRRFNAAILSIKRDGEKLGTVSGAGRVTLNAGDALVLLINDRFDWDQLNSGKDLVRAAPVAADSFCIGPSEVSSTQARDEQHTMQQVARNQSDDEVVASDDELAGVSKTELAEIEREFLVSMRVLDSSKFRGANSLVGQSVESSGLRGLPGLFLVAIEHENGTTDHAVGSEAVLCSGDVLWFAGERSAVATLRRIPGLEAPEDTQIHKLKVNLLERRLVEAVLSMRSEMIGQTIKQTKFRSRFDAAVIAVHRRGTRVISKIGDIVLEAGDVLLLDTGPNFMTRFRDNSNFLLVAEIENSTPPRFDKFYIALFAVLGMMIGYLFTSTFMSLFQWSVFAASIMLVSGCITMDRARKAVNWEVIVTIACAFGISNALQESGVAVAFGQALVSLAETTGTGEPGVLVAVYLATFLLSIVVANNAAALLMFPIALEATLSLGFDLNHMLFTLMLAASSSFASPFGYQTNLMVFGPGRYVFGDFLRFGFPLQVWQMVFSVVIVMLDKYWYISWIVSILFTIAAYMGMRSMHSHQHCSLSGFTCAIRKSFFVSQDAQPESNPEAMSRDAHNGEPVKRVSFQPGATICGQEASNGDYVHLAPSNESILVEDPGTSAKLDIV